ncbi:hypothetical protein RGUI_0815 [Rhodovulum sp. P5]|uniref:hypothetical protein n=1 Tax=Rhodovulum phage vB_RhkS_P1 TaxID=1873452 RepID=UPI00080AAB85|nr:hypothetical protein [Rhodovulum sp. P5]YP_009285900.1 hypothetical protein BI026_gp15 [Rhodovulum phage vB_RhkS_P1]ANT39896.1 hypothetical protein Rhks_15 [Rhodovulum phage vB_RhkS_P1]ARE38956.1 hypothetical protein RGUI_0815 [Rhodovulum sp. P5]
MAEPRRFTEAEMLAAAARAMGKIDARGRLGTSRISYEEIEAMAATLLALGVVPIPPTAPAPDRSPYSPIKETKL